MNLKEKNNVLRLALGHINYIVAQHVCSPIENIENQYGCNKAAFDQIAKVIVDVMRLDVFGDDLPEGTYFTPEAARKFAEEQAKKDAGLSFEDAPNLNEVLRNPPFKGGSEEEARERFGKFLSIPALGIQFRRYRSANITILVATWRDQKECNSHVYVLRVERDGDSPNCGWRATATNDGHVVFQLRTKNRSNCEQFALSAMKRYLKRGHRRTYRTIAKAKEEK